MRRQRHTGTHHPICQSPSHKRLGACMTGVLMASISFPVALHAADAHTGVHPKPGEIVLLRDVPTRPAVRQAPPGLALLVDPTPNDQLGAGLGGLEMSDSETGAISAPIQRATRTLNASLATHPLLATPRGYGNQSAPRGAATNTTPLSVVGNATRGVGSTITGALQALPLGKPPGG